MRITAKKSRIAPNRSNGFDVEKRRMIGILTVAGRIGFIFHGLIFFSIGLGSIVYIVRLNRAIGFTFTMGILLENAFGTFLVTIMAVGLLGFAVWRFLQAFFDTEEKGTSFQALFIRFIYVLIGLFYLWLAYTLVEMVFGITFNTDTRMSTEIGRLLSAWYGVWLLSIIAMIIGGLGIYQFYLAFTGAFNDTLLRSRMSRVSRRILDILGRFGFAARGIVFVGIAVLLVIAVRYHRPQEAGSQDKVLTAMTTHWGKAIGIFFSAGLIVFSLYEISNVRYRYIFRSEKEK